MDSCPLHRDHRRGEVVRHKIFNLLKSKDLLSDERIELLNSFRQSGFSVDASVTIWPQDTEGLERLCRYLLHCPLSLSRIHWTPGARTLFYEAKGSHDDPLASHPQGETLDVFEFLARVLTQIPQPRQHASTTWAPTPRERAPCVNTTAGQLTLHPPTTAFRPPTSRSFPRNTCRAQEKVGEFVSKSLQTSYRDRLRKVFPSLPRRLDVLDFSYP